MSVIFGENYFVSQFPTRILLSAEYYILEEFRNYLLQQLTMQVQ